MGPDHCTWPVRASEDEVVPVGAGLAAVATVVLFGSLFVAWYRRPVFCALLACPAAARSGWSALGAGSALIVAAALAGLLPLLGLASGRARGQLCAVGVASGLGAALFVVFRIAVPAGTVAGVEPARMAGPFIALLGALGVAGACALSGLGSRFFVPARDAMAWVGAVGAGAVVVIVSLFLPWARYEAPVRVPLPLAFSSSAPTPSAWHAAPTLAVLLLLGALAVVAASGLVAVIRWRCSFFALGVGGWLLAAIAVGVTPVAHGLPSVSPAVARLAAYGPGYYVCLVGASVTALAGAWAALGAPTS